MADTAAFREACKAAGLPIHVERSRSGNGAHVWFFFGSPVPAVTARRMACFLLTRAMSSRHDLDMASYDRLFPNQDTMPAGGFGNLIALPPQHEPRSRGNTAFLDDTFRPYPDQWLYLANIERISAVDAERIAADAQRSGQVLGVRSVELDEDAVTAPWRLSPSRRHSPPAPAAPESLPEPIRATLAQRLFVNKDSLPSSVLNALKRIAAFQNPEFYKKQSMRLSTALTPRVIACAEDFPEHVAIPRGCVDEATSLVRSLGSTLQIDDQRHNGVPIDHTFKGTLTDVQDAAVKAMLTHDLGVLVAPPGIGKTVAGIYLIAKRARNTLILVHRQPLLDQWIAQLALFLDVDPQSIGRLGGGKRAVTGAIDVAMLQSVVRKDAVADLVAEYGHVVVDECHHVPAVSFERVLSEVQARYVTGLTATPKRRDGQHPIVEMQLGPARYVVDQRSQAAAQAFQHRLIVRKTEFDLPEASTDYPIQRVYQLLSADRQRNDAILDDIIGALEEGRSPIVLTERKNHLEFLADRLRSFTRNLVVLKGGSSAKQRREALADLAAIPATEERLVLATGRYVGEGFDDARLDTLFLTMPVSWRGTLIQYAGRLHRAHPGKAEVRIYDYVDHRVPVLARMYERRLAGYRSISYESDAAPE
jgi:superfamily II DNA or RNA helicase